MFATSALSCSRNSFWQRYKASAGLFLAGAVAVSLCAGTALADNGNGSGNGNGGAVRLLTTIPVPGTALVQVVPTINTPGKANVSPAGTSHSVAVNPNNSNVFVPLPANNVFPSCLNGCIGVFAAPDENGDD